jgi:non-homologous end joining protein Ku
VPAEPNRESVRAREGRYIEITDEELEAIALESTRTIEIDEFTSRKESDELYI